MKKRRRGEATIRRLEKSGTYEGRISFGYGADGKRDRVSVYGKTRDEVERAIKREMHKRGRGNADAHRMKFRLYAEDWLQRVRKNNAAATYRLRETALRLHIEPQLGDMMLAAIGPEHIEGLLDTLRERDLGLRMIQVVRATLGVMFRAACKVQLIASNPVAFVDAPRVRKKRQRILSLDEARRLLASARAADEPFNALYVLALTTGMRQGELLGLTWANVDLDAGLVLVENTLTRDLDGALVLSRPKTESSRRAVCIPSMAIEALRAHRRRQEQPFGLVFTDCTGGALDRHNFTRRHFRPLLKAAGLPAVSFHSLRHAANSILLAAGENVVTLAQRLGHSSTRMTLDTYSHLQPTAHREAAAKIDVAFEIGQIGPNAVAS